MWKFSDYCDDPDFRLSGLEDYPDLKKVIISEGVTNISDITFRLCKSLRVIYIPSTVTDIGNAPSIDSEPFIISNPAMYHKPGTTCWDDPDWEEYKKW